MNGDRNGSVLWMKVIFGVLTILQVFVVSGLIYWAARVDENSTTSSRNARDIGKMEGTLEQITRQLDRIEKHLDEHRDQSESGGK